MKVLKILIFLLVAIPSFGQNAIKDLEPTVVLVSIDGFRADYLDIHKPKFLKKLAKKGLRAKWLIPSFPTKTFPNHYTIATGLLPENHGIIANNMYDPDSDETFALRKREEVQNPRWWGGEPIWVTAEKQGQKAGAFFFPGTEAKINGVSPTFWKTYDGKIPNQERVDTVLSWFDLPKEKRPTIFTLYFSDVDDAGHGFSPRSKETKKAVKRIDKIIKRLYNGLKKRKIHKKVNLIIVSDHGMAKVDQNNSIVLDEMFDTTLAEKVFWVSEITQIFPKPGNEEKIYSSIKAKLPAEARIYKRSEIPARFRYRNNKRIAPLLVIPKTGWRLTTRERFEKLKSNGSLNDLKGSHGYDNEVPEMRALFIGHGEDFKKGIVTKPFSNTDVYEIMCKILKLKPAENDGNAEVADQVLK